VRGAATFDASGLYRYRLRRWWAPGPRVAFVMLNPNNADARTDDPTIRRCVGFARRWAFGSVDVVNLFGYRTADPRELLRVEDPVGPENDRHLRHAVRRADLVVCAWGATSVAALRAGELDGLFDGRDLRCLGRTLSGAPRHPLYLRGDTRLRRFSGS
jgi:hypothetical protein